MILSIYNHYFVIILLVSRLVCFFYIASVHYFWFFQLFDYFDYFVIFLPLSVLFITWSLSGNSVCTIWSVFDSVHYLVCICYSCLYLISCIFHNVCIIILFSAFQYCVIIFALYDDFSLSSHYLFIILSLSRFCFIIFAVCIYIVTIPRYFAIIQ